MAKYGSEQLETYLEKLFSIRESQLEFQHAKERYELARRSILSSQVIFPASSEDLSSSHFQEELSMVDYGLHEFSISVFPERDQLGSDDIDHRSK